MTTRTADLLVLGEGQPIAVIEAKGITIPSDFQSAVMEQLRWYSRETASPWAVVIDPNSARFYRSERIGELVAELPTDEIIRLAAFDRPLPIGERTLMLAIERWLAAVAGTHEANQYPELAEFFADIKHFDTLVRDVPVE